MIDTAFNSACPTFPRNYPQSIKCLIRQSIINMKYYVESDDYSQYAFPALRALEGHIKYLITQTGITVGRSFDTFNKDAAGNYIFTAHISDATAKNKIETCYNYYKAQRDTVFHFGDILGATDNTRLIATKDEANEIIQKCISLICE